MTGPELYQLASSGTVINITLPLQDLLQLVSETDRLARIRTEAQMQKKEAMMTTEEFCKFWNISRRTLGNWEKRNVIKITRVAGECRIDPEEQKRLRETANYK